MAAFLLSFFHGIFCSRHLGERCDCMKFAPRRTPVNPAASDKLAIVIATQDMRPLARSRFSPSAVTVTTMPKPAMVSRVT
jgi:hypothetical protein